MAEKKKKVNYRLRLVLLYIGSFLTSILPLSICLIFKRGEYFTTVGESLKLTLGGIILIILVVFKVLGRIKIPGKIVFFGLLFVLAYLLESLLRDLVLLSGLALIGEVADALLFSGLIKKTKEDAAIEKTADVTTGKIEEVIKKYVGGGRV